MTYEELCRAHIESIIAAAAAQEVQTELSQRVSTWRQRIDPVLREEETRSAFDIHVYGEKILTQLGGLSLEEEGGWKVALIQVPPDAAALTLVLVPLPRRAGTAMHCRVYTRRACSGGAGAA
jgi:hypothetical protein